MIIIYKEPNKDGKLTFTKEELENLLEQARQEGYKEGKKDVIIPSIQPIQTLPANPTAPPASPFWWDKPTISGVNQTSSKPDPNTRVIV